MATYIIAASGGDYTTFAALVAAVNLAGNDVVEFRAATVGSTATFDERIAPDASGTAGNAITIRGRYGDIITIRGVNGGGFDYYNLYNIRIEHTSASNNYSQLLLTNCTNWLIQGVTFGPSYQSAVTATAGAHNNTFRACTFVDTSIIAAGAGEGIVLHMIGDDNLIEYCSVGRSLDRYRFWGDNNRIRNTFLGATDTADYPDTISQVPFHIDDLQTYENAGNLLTQTLYECNFSIDNEDSVGATNGHATNMQDDDDTGFNHIVFRFNIWARVAGSLFDFQNFNNVYIRNNTFAQINHGSASNFRTTGTWDLDTGAPQTSDIADVRNNLWYNCPRCLDTDSLLSSDWRPTNFTSGTNAARNPTGNQSVLMSGASPANLPQDDPVLNDPDNDDYSLDATSPLIGEGSTLVVSVGAGTDSVSLTVNNSLTIWADDLIKIGSGSFIRVSSVNYSTHVVTLATADTWTDGETVVVKGEEDVGACPFDYYNDGVTIVLVNTSLPSGANNLTATVSDEDACRKVEYLVDGIPVGSSMVSPYTVAYTADVETHTVTARLYKQWASAVPYVDDERELLASSVYRSGGFRVTAI